MGTNHLARDQAQANYTAVGNTHWYQKKKESDKTENNFGQPTQLYHVY